MAQLTELSHDTEAIHESQTLRALIGALTTRSPRPAVAAPFQPPRPSRNPVPQQSPGPEARPLPRTPLAGPVLPGRPTSVAVSRSALAGSAASPPGSCACANTRTPVTASASNSVQGGSRARRAPRPSGASALVRAPALPEADGAGTQLLKVSPRSGSDGSAVGLVDLLIDTGVQGPCRRRGALPSFRRVPSCTAGLTAQLRVCRVFVTRRGSRARAAPAPSRPWSADEVRAVCPIS